jgi:branched-chain amino acid transport system ATP-binding protein
VKFQDRSIAHLPAHTVVKQGLALVPEGRRVFTQLTVEENLEMGAFTRPKEEVAGSLQRVFELFPRLEERRRQVAGTLSGGEQQMLAMGRALMSAPRLMMLDEPSMGLAPILVEQIFSIIRQLHESGTTILLVEQNAKMARAVSDRSYVMESGRIVLADRSENLLNDESVKKAYLGG